MTDNIIEGTLERLRASVRAACKARRAVEKLEQCAIQLGNVDLEHEQLAPEAHALALLSERLLTRARDRASAIATQLGFQVAMYEIAPIARESNEPVTFITGNSFMPPLRDFGDSEQVWHLDELDPDAEVWSAYVERLEGTLEQQDVLLSAPDYDNALYVVDLARFEYVDADTDAETLSDEWERIERE